jgi:hypothetical protein
VLSSLQPIRGAPGAEALLSLGPNTFINGQAGQGTIGFSGVDTVGRSIFLTCGHVTGALDSEVYLAYGNDNRPAATYVQRWTTAARAAIYSPTVKAPDGLYLLDVGVLAPGAGVTCIGGAPDGASFSVRDTSKAEGWLPGATLVAWGRGRGPRYGQVFGDLWPSLPDLPYRVLCLVAQDRDSYPGDSGGPWFAIVDGEYVALGLHYGVTEIDGRNYAVVTDMCAALDQLGIERLLTTKQASVE